MPLRENPGTLDQLPSSSFLGADAIRGEGFMVATTILAHVLSHLIAKGVLSVEDVQTILADATNELIPAKRCPRNNEELAAIGVLIRRFS